MYANFCVYTYRALVMSHHWKNGALEAEAIVVSAASRNHSQIGALCTTSCTYITCGPSTGSVPSFKGSSYRRQAILFHVVLKHSSVSFSKIVHISQLMATLKLDAEFAYKLVQQVDLTAPYYCNYITFFIKAPGQVYIDAFDHKLHFALE